MKNTVEQSDYLIDFQFINQPKNINDIRLYQIGKKFCSPNTYVGTHLHIDWYELTVILGGKGKIYTNSKTEYVDVSEHIDKKIEMLCCHDSQIAWMRDHDHIDFPDMVKTCSRYRGYQCGADYAEGFRQCMVYLKGTTKRLLP